MTLNYEQVCKILREVVPLTNPPPLEINPNDICDRRFLRKISYKYEYGRSKRLPNKKKLSCIGSRDIDSLTGNEMIRLFFAICNSEIMRHADFLCFKVNGKTCAAIYLNYDTFQFVTASPPDHSELRGVYTLLFNDKLVEQSYQINITDEDLNILRQQAKTEFPRFLKTKFAQFDLYPFGVVFLGLAFDLAKHSSSKYLLKSFFPDLRNIPFAACVKLAFDYDQTGKVTFLNGELGSRERIERELIPERKATLACDTARDLIRNIAEDSGEFAEEKVMRVAEEVKQFYQIDDN